MGLFSRKPKGEQEPKEPELTPFERAKAKKPKGVQKLIDMYPYAWYLDKEDEELHWIKIIKDRPAEMARTLDLTRRGLDKVIEEVDQKSFFERQGWTGLRATNNHYKLEGVQHLVDHAIAQRHAMDWMMKKAVEGGIAEYDSEGTFKYKEEEDDS